MTMRHDPLDPSPRSLAAISVFGVVLALWCGSHSVAGILGDASKQAHSNGNDDSSDDDDRDDDRDAGDNGDGSGSLLWSIATSSGSKSRSHCPTVLKAA